jgi:hypothetical protein
LAFDFWLGGMGWGAFRSSRRCRGGLRMGRTAGDRSLYLSLVAPVVGGLR